MIAFGLFVAAATRVLGDAGVWSKIQLGLATVGFLICTQFIVIGNTQPMTGLGFVVVEFVVYLLSLALSLWVEVTH